MNKGKVGTKKTKPVAKPAGKPAARPTAKAAAKPAAKPATKAASKAASKATRPSPSKAVASKPAPKAPAKGAAGAATPKAATPKAPAKAAPAKALASRPAPAPVVAPKPEKKTEAPKPFQREYRKWLERLLSLRQQLVQEGERLGEEGLKALEQEVSVDHMADYGSDSYEQDTTLSLIENKSEALRDVDEAIRRIEVKTYGLCEECEQMIPHGRLEVLPHARYCVTCQAAREGVA